MSNTNNKAPHILSTSANLLGLCFIVITSLKALKLTEITIIDELTSVAIIMFMASCTLSFFSIRKTSKPSILYERIADIVFLIGLFFLFGTTMLIIFKIIS